MRILEIEKHFQNEDTLIKVLENLEEDFKIVDDWANALKGGVVNNPSEIESAIQELSGAYSNIRTVLAIADYELGTREVRAYNLKKIEIEKEGKFTAQLDSATKKEAREKVANYYRIKGIIEGYKDSAERDLSCLQNLNNNLTREHHNPQ